MGKRKAIGTLTGPYEAHDFALIGEPHATIYRQNAFEGEFFMQVATPEGADLLVSIVNAAVDLASRLELLGTESPAFAGKKVAHAVAKALGGAIDFEARRQAETHVKLAANEPLRQVAVIHDGHADEYGRKADAR